MRTTRTYLTLGFCLLAMAVFAWAQATRKPGLWEMTSTMTWQKSPLPPGMTMPAGANNPFGGGPRTTQVCLTQAIIDRYGAPVPQSHNGECQVVNVALSPTGMTADWVCTGRMTGKGSSVLMDRARSRRRQGAFRRRHADGTERRAHRIHRRIHIGVQGTGLRQRAAHGHTGQQIRYLLRK